MDDNIIYEEAISRLNEIVSKLETGKTTLDESLKLFEEGTRLSAACYAKLEDAQQKITRMTIER